MKKFIWLLKSRDSWKQKGIQKGAEAKYLRKRLQYYKSRNDLLKKNIKELKAEVEELKAELYKKNDAVSNVVSLSPKITVQSTAWNFQQIQVYSVLLVLKSMVSFRASVRVVASNPEFMRPKVPHFTSVINWCLRLGLHRLSQVGHVDEPWVALIDLSIDVGFKKLLVILRVKLSTLETRKGALTLEDCECIHSSVRETWKGQDIAEALSGVFTQVGMPKAILKDGGSELKLGLTLLKKEERFKKIHNVDDIGHKFACILKSYFKSQDQFKEFMEIITNIRKNLSYHSCSFLKPPALRTKGRFMSVTTIAKWVTKIQTALKNNTIETLTSKMQTKLSDNLAPLNALGTFLENFCSTCQIVENLLKYFKIHGINQKNAETGRKILSQLDSTNPVRIQGEQWIQKTLRIQCLLSIKQIALPVSTDILESLFGTFKHILFRCAQPDFNRSTLLISGLCGSRTDENIKKALETVSHKDLMTWQKNNPFETQTKLRRKFFKSNVGSETGNNAA